MSQRAEHVFTILLDETKEELRHSGFTLGFLDHILSTRIRRGIPNNIDSKVYVLSKLYRVVNDIGPERESSDLAALLPWVCMYVPKHIDLRTFIMKCIDSFDFFDPDDFEADEVHNAANNYQTLLTQWTEALDSSAEYDEIAQIQEFDLLRLAVEQRTEQFLAQG